MESTAQFNLVVQMNINSWNAQNKYLNQLLLKIGDEQLHKEIAPGRNTGIYLLGHLIAVSDALLPLLGFGERLFPSLEELFIKTPDKSGQVMPSVLELKEMLASVNTQLEKHFQSTAAEEWLNKHSAVSSEDFTKEPHRNKLNVLISRTNHMANHIGQLILLQA